MSAEEISKISEKTFKEQMEHPPSSVNEKTKPKSLMTTEPVDRSPKTTNTKVLDASLDKNHSDSSIAKVELFTPIDSLKKHPGSIV
ncbi:MAG: TolC family protein, partial [Nitrospinales bacterium]|nr:TolC family protein [Nitrospinales bacterium]